MFDIHVIVWDMYSPCTDTSIEWIQYRSRTNHAWALNMFTLKAFTRSSMRLGQYSKAQYTQSQMHERRTVS